MTDNLQQLASHFADNLEHLRPKKPHETKAMRRNQEKQRIMARQLERRREATAPALANAVQELKKVADEAGIPFGNFPLINAIRHGLLTSGYQLGLR